MTRAASLVRRLAGEPLVRFALLGAILFALHAAVRPRWRDDARQVVVTHDDVTRLREEHVKLMGRMPTDAETAELVERLVDDEIRYREALSLGLDKDDPVVRGRLAQKMQFLTEDLAQVKEPGDAELERFLAANDRYVTPATVTFHHLWFSKDKRGELARTDALTARARIDAGQAEEGDPFLMGDVIRGRTEADLDGVFGPGFGRVVFALPQGVWSAPIASSYGVHLVRVDDAQPPRRPALAEVRARVHDDFIAAERERTSQAALAGLRARYTIRLPEL